MAVRPAFFTNVNNITGTAFFGHNVDWTPTSAEGGGTGQGGVQALFLQGISATKETILCKVFIDQDPDGAGFYFNLLVPCIASEDSVGLPINVMSPEYVPGYLSESQGGILRLDGGRVHVQVLDSEVDGIEHRVQVMFLGGDY